MKFRNVVWAILVAATTVLGLSGVAPARAQASLLDTSFTDPAMDERVQALAVQSNGKVLAGGFFSTVRGLPRRYLVRFNADGSLDTGFNPDVDGFIRAIQVQDDGKILIGGNFTTVAGQPRPLLARLNADGTLDAFNPGVVGSQVNRFALQGDGKILVGGTFTGIGGQSRNNLARVDQTGVVDAFNPDPSNQVSAIAVQGDGSIVIGGRFTSMGGQPRRYLARVDPTGVVEAGFDPSPDDSVDAVTIQGDGKILVGGAFTQISSQNRVRIARLDADGTADAFNPIASGPVTLIAVQADGKVLLGGSFAAIGNYVRIRLGRVDADGSVDATFPAAYLSNPVFAMVVDGVDRIWVGGSFNSAGPSFAPYHSVARYFSALHTLTLTAPANGSIAGSAGDLACGTTCSAELGRGMQIALTATPATGYAFAGWGGGCAGTGNPLTLTLLADTTCTASFAVAPPPPVGPTPVTPPAPLPSFVARPLPGPVNMPAGGSSSGSISFAGSFVNPQTLGFTASGPGGSALPPWLVFDPVTATFHYTAPVPEGLPLQQFADAAAPANTIYPPLIRVAQVPVTLTATRAGQSYAATMQMSFYAPRPPVAMAAMSLSLDGALGNGRSGRSALSWDGGQVVFEAAAANLFPASPNAYADIVRYHGLSGDRDRLSQTAIPGGGVANAADGASVNPTVSADGRYAAFASDAPGIALVATDGKRQVYRTGLSYPRLALDGQTTPAPDLVSTTSAGIVGNDASDNPALSQDGRYVAFDSAATNLGTGLDGTRQVWRKDMQTGALDLIAAGRTPSLSWDGRWIAFEIDGQVHLRDMTAGTSQLVGRGTAPKLSARGDRVVFANAGKVMLGTQAIAEGDQPDISADGRFVVYRSTAGQIMVHDVDRGVGALVTSTASGGASWNPAISGDGATIAFGSNVRDLVPGNPPAGQAYIAANPLPLPAKTGYWYLAASAGQGWAVERWGDRAYVGGLAYDGQGRSQWLAGACILSGLTCQGTLTHGPAFTLTDTALTIGNAPAQSLSPFPIGGTRTSAYAGLPQSGWWYDPAANDGIGYFLGISTQPQPDGSVAQVAYLAMLAYDPTGRQVWQTAQAGLGTDLSFTGTLTQYAGGAPFGATAATVASGTAVGQVRLTFDGSDRARVTLPTGRSTTLTRFRF